MFFSAVITFKCVFYTEIQISYLYNPAMIGFQTQDCQNVLWKGAWLWSKPISHRSPSLFRGATKTGRSPRCVSTLNHQAIYTLHLTLMNTNKRVIRDSYGALNWLQRTCSLPAFPINRRILGSYSEKCTLTHFRDLPHSLVPVMF